ncbi:3-oxoacyl-ACP synthase [Croceivirga thetidis]|uniref:3-oxoacyl-ACP synthase n=1 Tax=Croceivirga thetidis TaxID=2721623 RepID=A0ABX1GN28_9FLAO|nr:3-oxoacyl-ACP synthase [Croceivirga thetidis]NKI31327.1 3-oxoacyl-ACP synthase [Croceivirga thetidis]
MKKELFDHCQNYCKERLERIRGEIKKISDSLSSETKSTAGDKHETGRAMLQLEREKLGKQLLQVEKMQSVLDRIPLDKSTGHIALGSLVSTNKANYYISISAGKFKIGSIDVFCISSVSPIGQLLLGKGIGDEIAFNGQRFDIINVE